MSDQSKELALTIINTSKGYHDRRHFACITDRYRYCMEFLRVASHGARQYEREWDDTQFTALDIIQCAAELMEHYQSEIAEDAGE